MEESKQNETFYCHSWFKCCTEKKSSVVTNLFFVAYFISVYVSFIIVKNYFCNGICNSSNIFSIKNILIIGYINHWPTYAIFSEFFNGFSLAWYSTLNIDNFSGLLTLDCRTPWGGHLSWLTEKLKSHFTSCW